MEPCPPVLSKPSSAPALLFPSPSRRFPPQGGAGDLSKPTGADFPQDTGREARGGRQAGKFTGKLSCFSISHRVGLIMPPKSVICLSQKRVNDWFQAAAAPGGGTAPTPAPSCALGPRKFLFVPGEGSSGQELAIGSSSQGQQKVPGGRKIRAGHGGSWHQPRFFSSPLLKVPKKVKNLQVKHSGSSGNYRCLNSTALHRNKRKIRQGLLQF